MKNDCLVFCKERGGKFTLEFVVCVIHPLPQVYYNFTVTTDFSGPITYSYSTVLMLFMLTRVYLLLRVCSSMSKWTTIKA